MSIHLNFASGRAKLAFGRSQAVGLVLLCSATVIASAQTLTTLVSFGDSNGASPLGSLVQGIDGTFYGTTWTGGTSTNCQGGGCGTVFKIASGGTLTTLYNFDGMDGYHPYGSLVQSANGDFYGTTSYGGTSPCSAFCGFGTIFKITRGGALTTLHIFDGTDGSQPFNGLIQGVDGYFYGTTFVGGTHGEGTIFKATASGTLTTLHSFTGADGANPVALLMQAANGEFYGTTNGGGIHNYGTIFKITSAGTLTTLHKFRSTDGYLPVGGLVQATDGNLYGTTNSGGTGSYGTIFRMTLAGKLTTLYNFSGTDGAAPQIVLAQGTDENFYGTAYSGGTYGFGTVFEITPSGTFSTLYNFAGEIDGANAGSVVQGTDGSFYGTTSGYVSADFPLGYGTVFRLSAGLGPFVETMPAFGKVQRAVKILGTNLTGATSVTFNGVAAAFTVVSPSLIATSVPAGATTGKIEVATPGGTLLSKLAFRVSP